MQEGATALGEEAATQKRQDRAYFLDLLGDSLGGLGRHEAAVEAYREAAQELQAQGAHCSYALCLLKIAGGYLSLHQPWHAIGYLEACLPRLRELGLVRHLGLAQRQLTACQAELAMAGLLILGEGRAASAAPERRPVRPRPHARCRAGGKFDTCPVQTDSTAG